ncbi:MAG: transcriptional regulator [Gemmobacter sp.]
MARPRSVPDDVVHDTVLALHRAGGVKAVTFSAVAAGAGLAASSLVQRHGSVEGMLRDARAALWARVEAATDAAASEAATSPKGAAAFLKAIEDAAGPVLAHVPDDPVLIARAADWRGRVEAELALRLGGGAKGREAAAILFAALAGSSGWAPTGARPFKWRDAVKRLA